MTPVYPWYSLRWFQPDVWQQFSFANRWAFYALPLLAVLLLLRYVIQRGARQRLPVSLAGGNWDGQSTLAKVVSRLRYLLPISTLLGVGFLLLTLARPQVIRQREEEQSEGIDIMLAMDVSSSMNERDLAPNRLSAAKQIARAFIDNRRADRIGLVAFAGEAYTICPLTTDYALLRQYLGDLRQGLIQTTGTAIGDALARSINRLRTTSADSTEKPRSKIVILLSDGNNTAGNLDPLTVARLAKAFGIRVYTIAVGQPEGNTDPTEQVDEGILKAIPLASSGAYFRAVDTGRLRQVFEQINRLEKAPVRVRVYEDVQDYYRIYLYWGICWLLLALFLKSTIFGNILED